METTNQTHSIEDALRQRLKESGASQPEISEVTGVPQTTVSRFLRGNATPNMRTYESLLNFVLKRDAMAAAGMPTKPRQGRRAARGVRKEGRNI